MATLERAIQIAHEAHEGEFRRSGEPYVTHPLAVMEAAHKLGASVTEQIVSVLHDVPENNPDWPIERLRQEGFGAEVIHLLALLTHKPGDDYFDDYIPPIAKDPSARRIKKLDIGHNLVDNPTPKQEVKYARALAIMALHEDAA